MKALVFLGGGRITTALIAGLRLSGYKKPIVVHDRNPQKLRVLKENFRIIAEPDFERAIAQAGLLILAVRPDAVRQCPAQSPPATVCLKLQQTPTQADRESAWPQASRSPNSAPTSAAASPLGARHAQPSQLFGKRADSSRIRPRSQPQLSAIRFANCSQQSVP